MSWWQTPRISHYYPQMYYNISTAARKNDFQSSYTGHMCQILIPLQTTSQATGLCFQGRCRFDLADWPPLCSALARTFSKTWEVKRSFMLTLLQLYHSECGPQLGSWGSLLSSSCSVPHWFAVRWTKVWKPSGSYGPVCLERLCPS